MKGQFFLISGILTILVLFLVKSSLNLSQTIENKQSLEMEIRRKEFLNVKNGLIKTIEYSYNKNESESVENYISYVRKRLKSRATELNGIAIEPSFKNVTTFSDVGLNTTVYNFLGEVIRNLSLNFSYDGSTQYFSNIEDGESIKADFVFNTGSDVNYTLIVNYNTSKENKQYLVQIPVEIGKSKFIGFFDLRMSGIEVENVDEFSKTVEIV